MNDKHNLELENYNLRLKIDELEKENKEIKGELRKLIKFCENTLKNLI